MIQFISGSHPLTTFHHSSLLSMILMYTWNAKNEWNWLETIDLGRGFDLGHFRGSSREFSLIVKFGRNLFFLCRSLKKLESSRVFPFALNEGFSLFRGKNLKSFSIFSIIGAAAQEQKKKTSVKESFQRFSTSRNPSSGNVYDVIVELEGLEFFFSRFYEVKEMWEGRSKWQKHGSHVWLCDWNAGEHKYVYNNIWRILWVNISWCKVWRQIFNLHELLAVPSAKLIKSSSSSSNSSKVLYVHIKSGKKVN